MFLLEICMTMVNFLINVLSLLFSTLPYELVFLVLSPVSFTR